MAMPGGIFDWPPVIDCEGREVRFIRATPGERTCRQCGEVVMAGAKFCVRCSDTDAGVYVSDFVPTVDYLREDEYVLMN